MQYVPTTLSLSHSLVRLPLLSVSDIVELDVPVRRVGGHDDPPGPDRAVPTKKNRGGRGARSPRDDLSSEEKRAGTLSACGREKSRHPLSASGGV